MKKYDLTIDSILEKANNNSDLYILLIGQLSYFKSKRSDLLRND